MVLGSIVAWKKGIGFPKISIDGATMQSENRLESSGLWNMVS